MEEQRRAQAEAAARHAQAQHATAENQLADGEENAEAGAQQPVVRDERKVGRNEPCPCGSGKKYKQCHGKIN